MTVMGMDYASLLARIVFVLASRSTGGITINVAELRAPVADDRLSFELNDRENELTIRTMAAGIEEAPLFSLTPPPAAGVQEPVLSRAVRRTPAEIAAILMQKQKQSEMRAANVSMGIVSQE